MLTRPVEGTFNRLTVKVNAGTSAEDSMDLFPVPLTFDSFSLEALQDEDIDAIVQVIVNRINTEHPDYIVTVSRAWTGTNTEPLETVYTPPPAEQPTP
jgi:hypothetical protein